MAMSHLPGSLVVAVSGLLAGALYHSEALPLHRYRLPAVIERWLTRYLDTAPPATAQPIRMPPLRPGTAGAAGAPPPPPPPLRRGAPRPAPAFAAGPAPATTARAPTPPNVRSLCSCQVCAVC